MSGNVAQGPALGLLGIAQIHSHFRDFGLQGYFSSKAVRWEINRQSPVTLQPIPFPELLSPVLAGYEDW